MRKFWVSRSELGASGDPMQEAEGRRNDGAMVEKLEPDSDVMSTQCSELSWWDEVGGGAS